MDTLFNNILTDTADLSFSSAITAMLLAILTGFIISATYMLTHRESYGKSFAITLVMLPVILSVIILFVGSNIARAFSLAGTLSIIRFRSAPGDPEDIGYIFFDIAAGLACGVGLYGYGILFVAILCIVMIVIHFSGFATGRAEARILKIVIPEDLNYNGIFDETFEKYTIKHRLIKLKTTDLGSLYEVDYDVLLKKGTDEKEFIDDLRCLNGNLNIMMSVAANES